MNSLQEPHFSANEHVAQFKQLRVAIVHYWFVSQGGGEKVVEALAEIFPQADIFTLVANPEKVPASLRKRTIKTSFLQKIPLATRFHRHFLLLQPIALEQFDLNGYNLVISSESGPAKGIITSANTCHVCYCHSPMRYLWDMHAEYQARMNPLVRTIYAVASTGLRVWDLATASRVDAFIANSNFVASRIWKLYRRDSRVIYPPVDVAAGQVQHQRGEYYLCAGRLVNYKRIDLAVRVCSRLSRKLKIIGSGQELQRLRRIAGPTVEFTGFVSPVNLPGIYAGCRALLFPGEEDFGIVPLEVQSFGRPVIAYASGGALETVCGCWPGQTLQANHTGVFFPRQSESALEEAILHFESFEGSFLPEVIASHARKFGASRFKSEMEAFLAERYQSFLAKNVPSRQISFD